MADLCPPRRYNSAITDRCIRQSSDFDAGLEKTHCGGNRRVNYSPIIHTTTHLSMSGCGMWRVSFGSGQSISCRVLPFFPGDTSFFSPSTALAADPLLTESSLLLDSPGPDSYPPMRGALLLCVIYIPEGNSSPSPLLHLQFRGNCPRPISAP